MWPTLSRRELLQGALLAPIAKRLVPFVQFAPEKPEIGLQEIVRLTGANYLVFNSDGRIDISHDGKTWKVYRPGESRTIEWV